MEIEITSKHENHLLKRFEVKFQANHPNEATPNRDAMRAEIAKAMSAKKDLVIIDWQRSDFGRTRTVGYAKVYASKDDAMKFERKPILVRMGLKAAEVKEKKEKKAPAEKAPAAKKEEKPAEKAAPKPEAPKKEAAEKPEKAKEEKAVPAKKEEVPKKTEGEKTEAKKPAKGGK